MTYKPETKDPKEALPELPRDRDRQRQLDGVQDVHLAGRHLENALHALVEMAHVAANGFVLWDHVNTRPQRVGIVTSTNRMLIDAFTTDPFLASRIQTTVPTATAVTFTATGTQRILTLQFANTTGAAITITTYLVPDGQAVALSRIIIPSETVPARSTHLFHSFIDLSDKDTLQCRATGAGLVMFGQAITVR